MSSGDTVEADVDGIQLFPQVRMGCERQRVQEVLEEVKDEGASVLKMGEPKRILQVLKQMSMGDSLSIMMPVL